MHAGPPRILKKGSPPGEGGGGGEERLRAGEILAAAEREAAALGARAEAEACALRERAEAAGLAEGSARAASLLSAGVEARLANLEAMVVEISLEVARRLVERQVALDPGAASALAKRALRAAAGLGDVVLRVSPRDAPAVQGAGEALRGLLHGAGLRVTEDPNLGPGEVLAEGEGGRIDGRLDARLDALRRALAAEDR